MEISGTRFHFSFFIYIWGPILLAPIYLEQRSMKKATGFAPTKNILPLLPGLKILKMYLFFRFQVQII